MYDTYISTFGRALHGQLGIGLHSAKGGAVETGCSDFVWCYVLCYYIILPQSTAPASHCTPCKNYVYIYTYIHYIYIYIYIYVYVTNAELVCSVDAARTMRSTDLSDVFYIYIYICMNVYIYIHMYMHV